jgi:adenosylmethionine-8-amino-7-oxononanoate aminotransferase
MQNISSTQPVNFEENIEGIRDRNRQHVWHSWSPVDLDRTKLTLSHGQGYRVWDIYGKEYIDALSNNMTCGYGNARLVTAISDQLTKLHGADLSVASHEPAGFLAERLAQILPTGLSRTLFVNSGSEGIESAVFIAKSYWNLIGEPRSRVISFAKAYHGATLVSRSVGGLDETKHPFNQPFPVTHVEFPLKPQELRKPTSSQLLLEAFTKAFNENPDDKPACVLVEPFINVGGCIVLPPGFLSGLRDLCNKHGTLLILDEVFTGYGRSGKMFAFQHENIVPDILVSSKGLGSGYMPITAVTAQERIYNTFRKDPILGGLRYGHTTSGHAASCVAALTTLDILEKEDLAEKALAKGKILFERFSSYTGVGEIVDVRIFGLVLILEMRSPEVAIRFQEQAKSLGLLVRLNDNAVMVVPPLIIDTEGINKMSEILEESLHKGAFL